jgi:hypothetical protein
MTPSLSFVLYELISNNDNNYNNNIDNNNKLANNVFLSHLKKLSCTLTISQFFSCIFYFISINVLRVHKRFTIIYTQITLFFLLILLITSIIFFLNIFTQLLFLLLFFLFRSRALYSDYFSCILFLCHFCHKKFLLNGVRKKIVINV